MEEEGVQLMKRVQACLAAVVLVALGLATAAMAQDAPPRGRWVIAKAELAPWADPLQSGGPQEEKRLVGRAVTFAAHSVVGPDPLGCAHAIYRIHRDSPDLLFEGGLAEPDANGKPRDAVLLARRLGMTTPTVATVETGCSEVAFHRLAPDTLVFGLNNRIYTLRPAP
jgi:hypothetical protein